MFEKRKCPACGKKVEKEFNYCPYCGEELEEREFEEFKPFRPFSFEDIDKEFERIDKMFSKSFFKFPKFERGGGISITIQSGTGMEPKIEVRTSGEYKKLEPEIKKRLGIKPGVEEVGEEEKAEEKVRIPKVTEEPEAEIKNLGNRQIISIKLPDVKEEDVEVKKLEQSMEIRAFAGDKAYFKLIPLPSNASIVKKEFKNGVLKIEVER
jgi:HSP20 family molecular chaperone IbpA